MDLFDVLLATRLASKNATEELHARAVCVDAPQPNLTAEERAQGRENLGIAVEADLTALLDGAFVSKSLSNQAPASFTDGAGGVPVKALSVAISADPGVTSCTVTRCGKNLFDSDTLLDMGTQTSPVTKSDGVYHFATRAVHNKELPLPLFLPNTQYAFRFTAKNNAGGTPQFRLTIYYTDETARSTDGVSSDEFTTVTFVSEAGKTVDHVIFYTGSHSTSIDLKDIQVEIADAATAYEPYDGQSVTVSLGSTVTEGTLDVVNGKLTVGGATTNVTPAKLDTRRGLNYVWADCGNVSLTYRCDASAIYNELAAQIAGLAADAE